jgi:hypothetical protein
MECEQQARHTFHLPPSSAVQNAYLLLILLGFIAYPLHNFKALAVE